MADSGKARLIAFYLPQFHPIPENDDWWGKGFTEWTNVAKARPLFRGHYQPHIPADLGFYDLRLPEVRQAQADMAREYGIHGFCYYHYWFHGKQLLERPFREVLESGHPDFPFCLCWANENWTRAWNGSDQQVLLEQTYSPADDLEHIRYLFNAFRDPRYIRVNGKPVFLVYRANNLPSAFRTASVWREEVAKAGLPGIYLCMVGSLPLLRFDPAQIGFDAAVDFQPDWGNLPGVIRPKWRWIRYLCRHYPKGGVRSYAALVEKMSNRPKPDYKSFPGVTPGWDHSPRRGSDARLILSGSTPQLYGEWLRAAIAYSVNHYEGEERFVFINAWNEWGEGNHLEPDLKWGRAYLQETRRSLQSFAVDSTRKGY